MFKNRLRELRLSRGLTQEKLASLLNVSKSRISMYENGNREPDFETLELIADFFNVNMSTLIDVSSKNSHLSRLRIPVLGYVKAGIPIEAVEEIIDFEEISDSMASRGEYFALSVKGDSMEPKISHGDVVIVRKQNEVENGELAVVLINGNDATIKRFYKTDFGITLISSNTNYAPFNFSKEEVKNLPVTIIGKVVELRAKF